MEESLKSDKLFSEELFGSYFDKLAYDEMFDPTRAVRPSWAHLSEKIFRLGKDQLQDRQDIIDWHLGENGVTYNALDDPNGIGRPWELNAIPFVMNSEEWSRIGRGVKQRAVLLNLILQDIYGKRELIRKGIIPQEVVFCHKSFLRPCDQMGLTSQIALPFYAADIARGPNGRMWVINDRTQAPSGMGYALENRLTMSRVFPELFEGLHIHKLANFYTHFKSLLKAASPRNRDNPLIVLLTPGSRNETYFEQAYLASFLGLPLVEGNDLVVRNNYLWLKSLKGLKQVDVVLRRVDEDYCDPLELYSESRLGVAGLLNVVRQRNVGMVNPIGSGILENRGLLPFMASAARYLLGEELILPQIATWWCGQKKERSFVLANLKTLVVKRIDRSGVNSIYEGDKLSLAEIEFLIRKIDAEPHLYVGQEKVSFSTVPNFEGATFKPRNAVLRTYAVANENSYDLMPGGLVRVADIVGNSFISNKDSGTSKDFWVEASVPESGSQFFDLPENSLAFNSGLEDLSSQTAENLFWVGRYISRTLVTARFLRLVYQTMTDSNYSAEDDDATCQSLLLQTLTHITSTYPGFVGEGAEEMFKNSKSEVDSLIMDRNRPGSLSYTIDILMNACFSLRKLFSENTWRVLDRLKTKWQVYLDAEHSDNRVTIKALDQLITRCVAFIALVEEGVLPDQGLTLYTIGQHTESSLLTITKLRSLLVAEHTMQLENEKLDAILVSMESLNIYRYTYRTHLKLENVLNLILLDLNYPRSVAYKIKCLMDNLEQMPLAKNVTQLTDYQKPLFSVFSDLRLADANELVECKGDSVVREALDELLNEITNMLYKSSNALAQNYFNHSQQSITHQPKTEF